MARHPLPQHAARTYSRIAMGVAAVCFVGAVTMFILPRPRIQAASTDATEIKAAPPPEPPKNPAEGIRTDWSSLASTVDAVNSPEIAVFKEELRRRQQEAIVQAATGETEENPKTSGGFAPPWRFLGLLVEPGGFAALVEIDQKQRFIRSGFLSADGYEVVSVDPDKLVVKKGRSEFTIRREESSRGRALATGAVFPSSPQQPPINRSQFDPTMSDETADIAEMRRRRAAGNQP